MEYKIEETSPVIRKVVVTVPVEEVNAALLATLALYRKSADVKGFRKGKAPSSIIESRYKSQIYAEATTDLVNYQLNEVLSAEKITPLSRISVDSGELVKDQEFIYSFSYEVAPKIDLPGYVGLDAEMDTPEVEDSEVEAVVDRLRNRMAELVDVEEKRTPQEGEVAVINFTAFENGEPLGDLKADNFHLHLGQGEALPVFEDIVKKLVPGETRTDPVAFPADFINTQLAGRTVDMRVTLKELKVRNVPEAGDDLAAKAGYGSMERMREAIVNSTLESRKSLNKSEAQKKLLDGLLANVSFDLPPTLVEENIDRMVEDLVQRLESRGKSVASLGKKPAELRDEFKPKAEEIVRSQIFLMAVATQENLTVEPQEVDEHLRRMAMQTRQDPEWLRSYYEEHNLMFALKDRLLADKAMEFIWSKAKVREAPPAEWKARDAAGSGGESKTE
ncbi:MAG: trigger factor [Thermodesulfobacteriota bacterium]